MAIAGKIISALLLIVFSPIWVPYIYVRVGCIMGEVVVTEARKALK